VTVREIRQTSRFKKDYKAAVRRGLPKDELRAVIGALANDEPLPERCRPHLLSGNWVGHWECHIRSDWLLIYKLTDGVIVLTLVRTGTHGDLFDG
jgi:mRNA interferase YafQ